MKKFLPVLMAAAVLLGMLGGCHKPEEVPETLETVPAAAVETPTEAATEASAEPPTEPQVNDTVFKAGTWMAQCGPTSRYYFFDEGGGSGAFADMKDGSGAEFTYVQTGDQGVMYLRGMGAGAACTVVVQDEDHITLAWENRPEEKMTYVSPLGKDRFHFYTHEELERMALEDYWAKNDPTDGSLMAAAMDNGDGTATIQIYQNLGDHNSTAAYYRVDRCTGEGENISNGNAVDLTNGTQDLDIYFRDSDAPLSSDVPHLVLDETGYAHQTVMHPLVTVTDFRVVSLEYVEEGMTYGFRVREVLYEAASMGPETGLILFVEMPETIPNVGVIYLDRNGEEQFYALMSSGLDGSPLLVKDELI